MKPYNHLLGYLHRWVVFSIGSLMVRVHEILGVDDTPFLHTHPFWYLSFVLRGGYTEQVLQADGSLKTVRHRRFSLIFRRPETAHRISAVGANCTTLFFAFYVPKRWTLMRHQDIAVPPQYNDAPDGLYQFANGFRNRQNGMWYALRETAEEAITCDRLSIYQNVGT